MVTLKCMGPSDKIKKKLIDNRISNEFTNLYLDIIWVMLTYFLTIIVGPSWIDPFIRGWYINSVRNSSPWCLGLARSSLYRLVQTISSNTKSGIVRQYWPSNKTSKSIFAKNTAVVKQPISSSPKGFHCMMISHFSDKFRSRAAQKYLSISFGV